MTTPVAAVDYAKIDPATLKFFTGTHPGSDSGLAAGGGRDFPADPNHQLTSREKKHRRMMRLEKTFGLRFNKKHYRLVS